LSTDHIVFDAIHLGGYRRRQRFFETDQAKPTFSSRPIPPPLPSLIG
jgi:hypothetical protein